MIIMSLPFVQMILEGHCTWCWGLSSLSYFVIIIAMALISMLLGFIKMIRDGNCYKEWLFLWLLKVCTWLQKIIGCKKKRHCPILPLCLQGFALRFRFRCLHYKAPYLRLIWLHPNHRRPITTQLYVVLTACPFLQLFNGQIIAQLSRRIQRGRRSDCIYSVLSFCRDPNVATLEFARSWRYSFIRDMSPRFGAKIQLLTLSTDTLIWGTALNSKYGLI